MIGFWETFFRESPSAHMEIENIFGLGIRCVLQWRYEWTNSAGDKAHLRGIDIFQVKEGLISEQLSYIKGEGGLEMS